ncbi:hypothetical protein CEUSTIGMA_g1253.t1 [Chlamydomonas eustigma]|uniref:Methyltransferase domain-containing protein n=1 Tax=Chlamydomonas eustigma TaxID=1157962 RepID=A0A250WT18_9CHLO|nr:hypothetical protein CEUSTIGMA_g1253.t1 [Chlamydomonas eustigma]|eukprot:GAX73802.1 hypothetical protein CEUSTIGMA_g1253.t1 [Chlamydomonas eustigma]
MLNYAYENAVALFISAVERGFVPDVALRLGIRYLLSLRAKKAASQTTSQLLDEKFQFVESLKTLPVAINTIEANEQHYELPTEYFLLCLGKNLKYSSCLYKSPQDTLEQAEENMLALYCQRGDLKDGQSILELGCGWGSMSLFMAALFPKSQVTGVSNSRTQREFIMGQAAKRGLTNLQIITANIVDFQAPTTYDRIVSIEMFEHMKNYKELMRRCASWLKPQGKLFVHIFVHKTLPYHFEVESESDWMSKHFFTGGTMPSLDLLLYFQDDLALQKHWYVNGVNYSKTLEAWLVKHDVQGKKVNKLFEDTYGASQAVVWNNRWRMFYIACSELFRYDGGEEWGVGHYLFQKK